MTDHAVLEAGRNVLMVCLKLSLPVLLSSLLAGVLVSIVQAVTQIQEFTLTFVPKMFAIIAALAVCGPWMLASLVQFMQSTYMHMTPVIK